MRDLAYEGNLILAKAAGEDVTNAAVRQRAAEWANAASGAAKLAQRGTRANVEKASMLSAGLTRAQIQQWGQVARGLSSGTRTDRILAAATLTSAATVSLAVGKYLNDYIGLEEFEFDPSKFGFGNITLPGGTVINVFPQEQILKTVTRSFRILAEEGVTEDDWKPILEEWGKLGLSRSSPAARLGAAAFGTGYKPGDGYKFGDLKNGPWDQFLNTFTPPIAQSLIREGFDPVRTPFEAMGVNAYPESDYNALDRAVKNDPDYGGKSYRELTDPRLRQQAQEKYGKLEPFGPEGERAADVLQKVITQQAASDVRLKSNDLSPGQWAGDYKTRKHDLAVTNEEIYHKLNLETKDPVLKAFYAAIDQSERPDGTTDWDKVDKYRAGLDPKDNEYISTRTGLVKIDTPDVRKFEKSVDMIEASGYFERTDQNFAQVKEILGLPQESYEEWKDSERERYREILGGSATAAYADAAIASAIAKSEIGKAMEEMGSQWREGWVIENPAEAYLAWLYGYYTPTKAVKEYLNRMFAGNEP